MLPQARGSPVELPRGLGELQRRPHYLNGSGGGGCMFAYAPENPEAVVEAIENQGGKAYIIRVDEGTKVEQESLFY